MSVVQAVFSPDSFSLSCSLGTDTRKSRQRKRENQDEDTGTYVGTQHDVQRDGDQVKEVLDSGVPPKGLEASVNFWRYRWFDARKKGMV